MSISSATVDSNKIPSLLGAWIGKIIFGLVAVVVAAGGAYLLFGSRWQVHSDIVLPFVSLLVAALFALSPLLACFAHTISIDRQKEKLDSLALSNIKKTQYFIIARANLESIKPASVNQPDFVAPMLLFATIILFCSILSFMALFRPDDLAQKSTLLGGLYVLKTDLTDTQIKTYQSGTLVVAAIAFIGAYLALFNRLLNQINNNDIYPISFHYYSIWLITAMTLAAVMRHFASVFGFINDSEALLVIALAIGAVPAPFFTAFIHWAFSKFQISGDKNDPDQDKMPTNLNLLMIDGLANEKIDRLAELGISDAQVLSCQNPLNLWVRLPYDLGLIVDWIAQAQLYVCLREDAFHKARSLQMGDIHTFVSVLSDSTAAGDLCDELSLKTSYVVPLLASLNASPCFVRLREVKQAMLPDSSGHDRDPPPIVGIAVSASPVAETPTQTAAMLVDTDVQPAAG
jgi:hypothetical protein